MIDNSTPTIDVEWMNAFVRRLDRIDIALDHNLNKELITFLKELANFILETVDPPEKSAS
jgi:hypothetical protein